MSGSDNSNPISAHDAAGGTVVVQNTLTISVFNILGLVSGLAVDVLLTARFGLGREMDALFIALTLPQLIVALLFVALNAVLVPTFSRALEEAGAERVWELFSMISTLAFLFFVVLAMLGAIASPFLVSVIAPGLDKSSTDLAIRLSRVVFWMVLPAGLAQTMSAILNTYHRFAAPAALHFVLYSVVGIFALLGMSQWGTVAVAAGYVVGALAQVLMLALAIRPIQQRFRPLIRVRDPEMRRIVGLLGPSLLQGGLGPASVLVERVLSSYLPAGSISALGYARRMLRAVSYAFSDSVSTALLPRFSSLSAQADLNGLKRRMALGVKIASLMATPVVALLVLLNVPIIRLAFQRGAFDASATELTAGLMALYVLSMPPAAITAVTNNTFFAMPDTLTPLYLNMVTLGTNVLLGLLLISVMGPYGLPLSLLLARCVGLLSALWVLRRRIGSLSLRLRDYYPKLALAVGLLAGSALGVHLLWETRAPLPSLQQLLAVVSASALGLLAYGVVLIVSGIEEVGEVVHAVRRRLTNRHAVRIR